MLALRTNSSFLDQSRYGESTACCESPDDHDAQGAGQRMNAGHLAFKEAKDKKTDQGDDGGDLQTREAVTYKKVGA